MNRCERNNNPLNIIRGANWKGLKSRAEKDPTEIRFCQFTCSEYGFRAAWLLLNTYNVKYGLSTIKSIIERWCPDHTATSYADYVSKKTGLSVDYVLNGVHTSKLEYRFIILAMARFEGYTSKSDAEVMQEILYGYKLAYENEK